MSDSSKLLRLTYVSTSRSLSSAELDRVVAELRARSAAAGLTGALFYNGLNFLETLEGDASSVDRAFAQVLPAPHHDGAKTIERSPIDLRHFSGWTFVSSQDQVGLLNDKQSSLPEHLEKLYRSFFRLSGGRP